MKRWGWAVLLLSLAAGLTAQALDVPVVMIKSGKTTALISKKDYQAALSSGVGEVQYAYATKDHPVSVDDAKAIILKRLVDLELAKIDMEAQGVKATDDDLMKQFRSSNPGMSDAQIKKTVEEKSGQSWDAMAVNLKQQIARQKYFSQFPQFQELGKIAVADQEIQEFFQGNQDKFVAPDYIRLSHIFFDTKAKPKGTVAEIQKKAEETQKKIASGQATFEEMATTVSEDPTSAKMNGDIGYIPRTLESAVGQQLLNIFGQDFLTSIFLLKKGEVSGVLASNSGLHIVRVTQKIDKHFMTLDEGVYPGQQPTVRAAIQQTLLQKKMIVAQDKILGEVMADKKKASNIQYFEKNF